MIRTLLLLSFALPVALMAQTTFTQDADQYFFFNDGDVEFADVDGDGDPDLFLTGAVGTWTSRYPKAILYLNDGSGNFTPSPFTDFQDVWKSDQQFADLDGDGDLDLVIAGDDGMNGNWGSPRVVVYRNENNGNDWPRILNGYLYPVFDVAMDLADVDGDNDIDLFLVGSTAPGLAAYLYLNDGTGVFTRSSQSFTPTVASMVRFMDLDNDGDYDLFSAGAGSSGHVFEIYHNDGFGNFTLAPPSNVITVNTPGYGFADLDNDSDLDLVVSGVRNNGSYSYMYRNDGSGNFVQDSSTNIWRLSNAKFRFADVDDDGDQDVLLAGDATGSGNTYTYLYYNDGTGHFVQDSVNYFSTAQYGDVEFVDLDGDQDQDIVIVSGDHHAFPNPGVFFNGLYVSTEKPESSPLLEWTQNHEQGTLTLRYKGAGKSCLVRLIDLQGRLREAISLQRDIKLTLEMPEEAGVYVLLAQDGSGGSFAVKVLRW